MCYQEGGEVRVNENIFRIMGIKNLRVRSIRERKIRIGKIRGRESGIGKVRV